MIMMMPLLTSALGKDRVAEASSALSALAEATPLGVRGFAAVGGALLIVAGARFYRAAVAAPGAILGLLLTTHFLRGLTDDTTLSIAAIGGAVIGAMITGFIEKLAIRLAGALVGAVAADIGWSLLQSAELPLWAPAAGALVGLLIFPSVWRLALKLITPFLGALCVAYAAGSPNHPLLIGGLTLAGALIQLKAFKGDEDS